MSVGAYFSIFLILRYFGSELSQTRLSGASLTPLSWALSALALVLNVSADAAALMRLHIMRLRYARMSVIFFQSEYFIHTFLE